MLKLLLSQTSWNIAGTLFGFGVGFFVKMFLINKVGVANFGLYIIATSFEAAIGTIVALALPSIILKFLPRYVAMNKSGKSTAFSTKFLIYSLLLGLFGGIFTMILSGVIASTLFHNLELKNFIFFAAFYIPISIFSVYITSIYRSVFKIREIILYSTFYLVTIRALLTFIIFSFTDNILYFMYIEIFSMSTAAILLVIKFKSNKFKLFSFQDISKKVISTEIAIYGKRMYFTSLLGFSSGYAMMFIMSITLPPESIGIYAVLMVIAGLTNFLLSNINRVFSPIISHLVTQKDITALAMIYRYSTFFINIFTIPFILIVLLFAKQILTLYGDEFTDYTFELAILFLGNFASISIGSSGTIMSMAGLEREEMYIQLIKTLGVVFVSIIFLPIYGLKGAVLIYAASMLFVNTVEVFFIYKKLHIFPLDKDSLILFVLFMISLLLIYFYHQETYKIWEYIVWTILIYGIYLITFNKKIIYIMKIIREK